MTTAGTTFTITLNGDPYAVDGPLTLAALLARLELHPQTVAVELNHDIVTRDRFASTTLAPGDQVEVVRMIGGG